METERFALVYPRGREGCIPPPISFTFMQFGVNWGQRPTFSVGGPPSTSGKIWIRHCTGTVIRNENVLKAKNVYKGKALIYVLC